MQSITKRPSLSPLDAALCQDIVEGFESALLVVDAGCRAIDLANGAARELLGLAEGPMPKELAAALREWIASEPPTPRFTGALGLSAGGRRLHARVKTLGPIGAQLLVMLTPFVVRERDLDEALRHRFALSRRELQIVLAVKAGASNAEIAERLGLTEGTVKNYVSKIFTTMDVRSRTHLLAYLQSLGTTE